MEQKKWTKVGPLWVKKGSTPWADGHYLCKGMGSFGMLVEGESTIMQSPGVKEGDPMAKGTWKSGDFGKADPAVVEATGKKFNNWYMEAWNGMFKVNGVLSEDGKTATFINILKEVDTYQWVTEEEFAAFKDSGDPADAPPSHYKPQPENQGKFIFISGAPGLGKSTTGLLLSKMAGYVYYEADCFANSNNPYLPPDAKDPSMDSIKQKPLKGIPQDRLDAISGGMADMMAMLEGKEYNMEPINTFYTALCKDLSTERKRLGGDWVVAQAVPTRSLRDVIRAELGPDLVFVVLNMKKEDQKKRITARHGDGKSDVGFDINGFLEKAYDLYEPATADEPNAIDIDVTADMTREDVAEKILKAILKKENNEQAPWTDGHYICEGMSNMEVLVEGEKITSKGGTIKEEDELAKGIWKYGEFGEADPAVAEATGKKFNNWNMEAFGGMFKVNGILSEDGKKVTFINMLKDVDTYQWVTEEEFAAFRDSGDSADAPPSHYKPQPENLGKFLFISGAPGLGKSTTGLLLSKMAGYVYYEADCFGQGTNPYLPPDAKDPTLDAMKQNSLKGIPQDRLDAVSGGINEFMAMIEGKEYNIDPLKTYYTAMCKDLATERKRLGGDWVVAQAVPKRFLRDVIRAELGPDLVFVVLNMKKEDQKKRITARHGESGGSFDFNAWLEKAYDIYEPATEDEPNAIGIDVTADMTREDVLEKILKTIQEKEKTGSTPWIDGHYTCKEQANYTLLVEGESMTMEGSTIKEGDDLAKGVWKHGEFGEADPAVAEATGKKFNNWSMEAWGGLLKMKGVLSDDGKKVTFINLLKGLDIYQWVTEEELAAYKDSGDPADAPQSHYNPQPENQGKFLFISGAPGLGKSTTGHLLSKMAGYVYYEADCFLGGTNPYLPPDAKEPSMDAIKQKALKGVPQDRIDAVSGGMNDFMAMIEGKEYDIEPLKTFYAAMCKDLAKERKRLGGDWAVAQAVPFRSLRDLIRAELGPDLLFVVLNMKKEDQKKRITARHGEAVSGEGLDFNAMLEKAYDIYEPATADEPNAIDLEVTADMTRDDVIEKILKMVQEKENNGKTPWADGHYTGKDLSNFTLLVEGESMTMEGPTIKEGDDLAKGIWKYGNFGEADPAVAKATGKKFNNWNMEAWGGLFNMKGVLSDDGKKVTFINMIKEVDTYQWRNEEDFAAFKDSGDPADAPPSHYKPQPENQGKFIFISGAPGLGKSTTGLLLSKMAGYVYYEADCFAQGTNPYLPPDSKDPSLDAMKQRPLKGIPQDRLDALTGGMNDFMAMIEGKEYNIEPLKVFYAAMCKDLASERKRMGGDWVVAQAVPFRSLRDVIRAELGPDLVFVVLNMKKEDQKKRITARHGEGEGNVGFNINEYLEKAYDLYEPATEDEPNAIDLEVTADMTREDVVEQILKLI